MNRADWHTIAEPRLGNQYRDDRVLRNLLARHLDGSVQGAIEPELDSLGELAGGDLYRQQLSELRREPELVQWDAWGHRVDIVRVTPLWQRAERLAAEYGLIAAGYETRFGAQARLHQFALAYLFIPATDFYGCPLAMTDGAAFVLHQFAGDELRQRAMPHLLSRDPTQFWTSGQWMTETAGGSDVSGTETVAREAADGSWHLQGRKWFTSAVTADMTLTLARPQGNPDGSRGLALFYAELRDAQDRLCNIEVLRLKDKLGTRKVPTAELYLDGLPATPVAGLDQGVARIAPMLNITRTWNAITCAALMRRGLALAWDYAGRRHAFGGPLSDKPLHRLTLARVAANFHWVMQLGFDQVRLLGQYQQADGEADEDLFRLLTPIVKLASGKACVASISEILESFGGAGYVEDTGLPVLLRDAQVLSIWEGTTNVLSLDLLRAMQQVGGLEPLYAAIDRNLERAQAAALQPVVEACRRDAERLRRWTTRADAGQLEFGARDLALTAARAYGLALLAAQAQFDLEHERGPGAMLAARLLASGDAFDPATPDSSECAELLRSL